MSFKWKEVELQDVITINPSYSIKKGKEAKKIAMTELNPFSRKISGYEIVPFNGGTKFKNEDTLIARITPCLENGKTALVTILDEGEIGFGSTEFIVFRGKEGISDNKYIYYLSISPTFRNMAIGSMTGTSGRQRAQVDFISKWKFELPDLKEQKYIASTLSILDDKIELNNAINKNLEEMAQALFKRWFIDFEFPNENGEPYKSNRGEFEESELGLIPKGWKVDTIGNSTSIVTRGIAPKYAEDTGKFVINQKCIRYGVINTDLARQHQSKVVTDKALRFGDVLINSTGVGTLGRVAQVYEHLENYTVDSHVTIVRAKSENLINYLGSLLQRMQYEFEHAATGSTGQTELGREAIKKMKILLPNDSIVKEYSELYASLYEKITLNLNENKKLVEIRDTLLPKLMSGEIRVPLDNQEFVRSNE